MRNVTELLLLLAVAYNCIAVECLQLYRYPYGLMKIDQRFRPGWGEDIAEYAASGRIICAGNPDKTPTAVQMFQYNLNQVDTDFHLILSPTFLNQSIVEDGKFEVKSKEIKNTCCNKSMPVLRIPFDLLSECTNTATLDRSFDYGDGLEIFLIPKTPMMNTAFRNMFIVMDLGAFDYNLWNNTRNGVHKNPSLAIGGNITCSLEEKKHDPKFFTVYIRKGTRTIGETMSNKDGIFYMQIYNEPFDEKTIHDQSSDMNIFIEHQCKSGTNSTGTAKIPLYVDIEKADNYDQATTYNQASLFKADYAACPTVWIDHIDLKNF